MPWLCFPVARKWCLVTCVCLPTSGKRSSFCAVISGDFITKDALKFLYYTPPVAYCGKNGFHWSPKAFFCRTVFRNTEFLHGKSNSVTYPCLYLMYIHYFKWIKIFCYKYVLGIEQTCPLQDCPLSMLYLLRGSNSQNAFYFII